MFIVSVNIVYSNHYKICLGLCLHFDKQLNYNLNLHVSSYTTLCEVYAFLILSVTEVNYERSFSKPKQIKT